MAAVEIVPRQGAWKKDYEIFSRVLGIRHERVVGEVVALESSQRLGGRDLHRGHGRTARESVHANATRWLRSNMSVDIRKLVTAVRKAIAWVQRK